MGVVSARDKLWHVFTSNVAGDIWNAEMQVPYEQCQVRTLFISMNFCGKYVTKITQWLFA